MRLFDELHAARCLVAGLRSQWWPAARIEAYQEARLVAIMRHALTQVPFYRGLGISAADINQGSDLQRFPLIRKRDVQQEPRAFLADGLVPDELHASRTSGSSGEPMTTYFDRESWLLTRYALKMRRVAVTGGLPFMRQRATSGRTGRRGARSAERPRNPLCTALRLDPYRSAATPDGARQFSPAYHLRVSVLPAGPGGNCRTTGPASASGRHSVYELRSPDAVGPRAYRALLSRTGLRRIWQYRIQGGRLAVRPGRLPPELRERPRRASRRGKQRAPGAVHAL